MSDYDLTDHNYNIFLFRSKYCSEMKNGKRCGGEIIHYEPKITYWGHDDEPTKINMLCERWCSKCHVVRGFERRFKEIIPEAWTEGIYGQ